MGEIPRMEPTFVTIKDPNGNNHILIVDWIVKQGEWEAIDFQVTSDKDLKQFCMVAREFLKG